MLYVKTVGTVPATAFTTTATQDMVELGKDQIFIFFVKMKAFHEEISFTRKFTHSGPFHQFIQLLQAVCAQAIVLGLL